MKKNAFALKQFKAFFGKHFHRKGNSVKRSGSFTLRKIKILEIHQIGANLQGPDCRGISELCARYFQKKIDQMLPKPWFCKPISTASTKFAILIAWYRPISGLRPGMGRKLPKNGFWPHRESGGLVTTLHPALPPPLARIRFAFSWARTGTPCRAVGKGGWRVALTLVQSQGL